MDYNEFDPFGKTVTELSDGTTITCWHFIEAIENMADIDADFISRLAKLHWQGDNLKKAMCWETLLQIVNDYWEDAERKSNERLEDVTANFHLD